MDYYSNTQFEEFDRLVEFLGFTYGDSIKTARNVFIDLDEYIFPRKANKQTSFANHKLSIQELNLRFNRLLGEFAEYETKFPGQKQNRYLTINLIDVKSSVDEELFRWSYYNHKFAASQGQDQAAMNEWHKLESRIDVNKLARFKALREGNLAFYMHVINNHQFFDKIIFAGLPHETKNETQYGLDVAEEQYLTKSIRDNQAQGICRVVENGLGAPVLNLVLKFKLLRKLNIKTHILANSRKLNKYLLLDIKALLAYMEIQETNINDCDFVFLINDLDLLSVIPEVNTGKPIFTVDLSQESTPNFSYMLLRDEGFEQIFGYAKRKADRAAVDAMIRSLCCGLMMFITKRKFKEQLAINCMDDYFLPLSKSLSKDITDFQTSIDMLTEKLEKEQEVAPLDA